MNSKKVCGGKQNSSSAVCLLGARDWVRAWCQSSGPESGVWIRVWGRSLGPELGQSLGPKSRHPKPKPEMRLGESLESGCGSGFGSGLVRVWGSGLGARVWSLGSESESRHPKPNRAISVWSRVLGLGLDQGLTKIGSEFGARVWSLGSESESRHPEPNRETGLGQSSRQGQSLESGSEFGCRV